MDNVDPNLVNLNVSGKLFTVPKDILLGDHIVNRTENPECNYFRALLSGNYKRSKETYLHTDSDSFSIILNYLRGVQLTPKCIPKHLREVIKNDCLYYDLSSFLTLIHEFEEEEAYRKRLKLIHSWSWIELNPKFNTFLRKCDLMITRTLISPLTGSMHEFQPGTVFEKVVVELVGESVSPDLEFCLGFSSVDGRAINRENRIKLATAITPREKPIKGTILNASKKIEIDDFPHDIINKFSIEGDDDETFGRI